MMSDASAARVLISIDGREVEVQAGAMLAAALMNAGVATFRRSVNGAPRGPLCGMGSCHECRVTVDGVAHVRSCLEPVRAGMRIATAAAEAWR
jgi:D-hydroxyproline dehydrogenase subunit gamma